MDERLYQRGLLAANPLPPDAPEFAHTDPWRLFGRGMVGAPFLLPGLTGMTAAGAALPEIAMSMGATSDVYDALDALRKRLGLFE